MLFKLRNKYCYCIYDILSMTYSNLHLIIPSTLLYSICMITTLTENANYSLFFSVLLCITPILTILIIIFFSKLSEYKSDLEYNMIMCKYSTYKLRTYYGIYIEPNSVEHYILLNKQETKFTSNQFCPFIRILNFKELFEYE